MHPTTPPTPSRRVPRPPKNPRRRVRSESDRKKHAGWRHCPRCNRSVSTNGRNFYHHMHKCDRVYFADLIAKVDSAVTPVSTPLPPPLPRLQQSPRTPAPQNRAPVKMSETQRVIFLQQLCFLRVYDRTVDAVLNQIEQTDASIFSPAAFEAVRRAKGIETPQRVFPNPKTFSPPYSPLAPSVRPPQSSIHDNFASTAVLRSPNAPPNSPVLASQPANTAAANPTNIHTSHLREPRSNLPNGAPAASTPYTSNGSLSVSTTLSGHANHTINPTVTSATRIVTSPSPSGNPSAPILPQMQSSAQPHATSALPSSNGHMPGGMPVPGSSGLLGTGSIPEQPAMPANIAVTMGISQASALHSRPITTPGGRAVSEPMAFSRNIRDITPGMTIPSGHGTSTAMPISGSVALPTSGSLVQETQGMLSGTSIPQNQHGFPTGTVGNSNLGTHSNLSIGSSMGPQVGSNGNWRGDPQRFPAPTGTTSYSGPAYGSSALPAQPQSSAAHSIPAAAAAVANTPVSKVATAMSISSVINS